ncbi:hypothetical protein A9326_001018 [Escherichia coli]|nr:hypothetical protein [Escherichia coli]ELW2622044.1 hypothetical protein [Escherichia coli O26]EEU0015593.1 hypothetical protein [Escherichia coli]EEU5957885.1 hypothetical protein [Escherichia coli]EEX9844474.1 hypothetical protein [Escherichia coli]
MAKNDFKAFATGKNANVMSQEEWEALPALLSGFTAGKASSAQVNKVIRQASFIAAALAQFVSDKTQRDVLDNGDLPGFVELLGSGFAVEYLSRKNPFGDIKSDGTVKTALENLGLGEARYVIQRGANANGAWIRWSDGAIEVFGTGGSNDNGLAKVVYPIALPKLSRFISIAERIGTDYGGPSNNVHVSMIVDDQVTNTGFYVRCQMYDGTPSINAFSWRVYCAPV